MPFPTYVGRARKRTGTAFFCFLFLSTTTSTSWAAGAIEEVVVTAQRTEESLQDVPIAVTAFTGAMLEEKQIINPSDLQMAAPNVSFTATNFGGSSFSIRGIGNLVVGASEGGVSFHTNEIPLSTNLVAAEFFDMERVEVLRGPQGTLYGRQATGGAINFVTAKPELDAVGGNMDVEYGDYDHQRLKGAINLPVTETFGLRVAGMTLERDGYIENTAHNQVGDCLVPGTTLDEYNADPAGSTTPCTLSGIDDDVDGRDLYSYRATALWTPTDELSGWIMFSKFHENDDRARITNQICETNSLPVNGCDPDGFGFDKPHLGATTGGLFAGLIGAGLVGEQIGSRAFEAPPGGFREMHTDFEPEYYNDEDTWLGQVQYDFEEYSVTLQGGMQEAQFFSRQDYLMDVGADLYATPTNPTGYWPTSASSGRYGAGFSDPRCNWNDGTAGVFGGCNMPVDTTRVFAYDQSDGESESWTIEARLQSAFDGPFNFLVGASQGNSQTSGGNYYVNANTLDLVGLYGVSRLAFPPLYPTMFDTVGDAGTSGELDSTSYFGEVYYQLTDTIKFTAGLRYNDDQRETSTASLLFNAVNAEAVGSTLPGFLVGFGLLDPNYLTNSVEGREAGGTNWTRLTNFLLGPLGNATTAASEKNIALYHGVSEADWDAAALTPAFSAARFAIDGLVPIVPGFNETRALTGSPTEVDFQETTGRFGVDWQWSDTSMVYGFFTRGYKPGGFNPPINPEFQATSSFSFESEQVDAFEIGSKNMLFEDTLMMNSSVFYYDYGDLQVSRIANNSSLNDNIDAEIYGLEIEGLWRPEQAPGLSVDFSYSYLKAEAAGGATSIDPMDRTGGDDAYIPLKNIDSGSNTAVAFVARRDQITQEHIDEAFSYCRALSSSNPFNATTPTQATGCPLTATGTDYADGLPTYFSKSYLNGTALIPAGLPGAGTPMNTAGIVDVSDGFETDIDGNSLPASPENTVKLGVAYDWQLSLGTLTPRLDYHWRGESYGREFNTKGDEIDAWDQLNVSLGFVTTDGAWQALLWVRNLEDEDNVTGHYLTSDTSGFFRNYFLTEPRIWGASLRYNFGGMR